ncbi:CrcB family protein [Rhodococcus sp. HNM0569]|uniref:fluoride efflux transporter FluC n=1 Tax=Rhodococcus sp. HNM0569 TaxID=2716340 RepID=UPI003211DC53
MNHHPTHAVAPPLHVRGRALAAVAAGGALGTLARYGVGLLLPTERGHWPWATFSVNVVGAFVLGALLELLVRSGTDSGLRQTIRLGVGTGLLGAFTTYSAFAVDIDLLVHDGHAAVALSYAAATLAAGFAATALGIACAARWGRGRR